MIPLSILGTGRKSGLHGEETNQRVTQREIVGSSWYRLAQYAPPGDRLTPVFILLSFRHELRKVVLVAHVTYIRRVKRHQLAIRSERPPYFVYYLLQPEAAH